MHIAALPSCVSSLLSTFRLFQAFLGCAECFFPRCQAFFSYGEPFSALPRIFLPRWSLVSFANHFSSVLSTSQFFRAFFGHAKHFSNLPIISLLDWEVFRLFQAFCSYAHILFCCAKPFTALPSVFLLRYVVFLLCCVLHGIEEKCLEKSRKGLSIAEKCLAEQKKKHTQHGRKYLVGQKNAQHRRKFLSRVDKLFNRRKMLGRAGKCLA